MISSDKAEGHRAQDKATTTKGPKAEERSPRMTRGTPFILDTPCQPTTTLPSTKPRSPPPHDASLPLDGDAHDNAMATRPKGR
jgi:hypothetical protein